MTVERVIPKSWTINGFGFSNPPLTAEDWEKVYTVAFKGDSHSEEELKKAAAGTALFMEKATMFRQKLA